MTGMDWYNDRVNRRLCVSCGAEMPEGDTRRHCENCRKKYKDSKEAKVIHHYDANKKLDQDAAEAFSQGLTYGKWRMREEMKKRGEIRDGQN